MIPLMTASAAAPALGSQAPTAVEVDRLSIEFLDLEKKVDQAYKIATALDEPHERMKEELIFLVDEFGSAHAEKSKLLHGTSYEIMATFGMSTSIDAAAAERFANALRVAKQTKLLNKIFEQTVRYTLAADASSIMRSMALPRPLLSLFAQCVVSKPRTPTLKVRQIVTP
jgi:hypothetical protein